MISRVTPDDALLLDGVSMLLALDTAKLAAAAALDSLARRDRALFLDQVNLALGAVIRGGDELVELRDRALRWLDAQAGVKFS